jgi:hypothetical protein
MKSQFICLALAFVLLCPHASAQWVQTGGRFGGAIVAFAVSGTDLFAGAPDNGVFHSSNNGTSWTAVNSGLTNTRVSALAVLGTKLLAGTRGGVFLSTNSGASWTAVYYDPSNTFWSAFAVSGTNLFAGTGGEGVFLSTNSGTSWTEVNFGLTSPYVFALAVSGTNLFAGTGLAGVFLSTNSGTSWTEVNSGLTNSSVSALAVSGTNLFAGTRGGVFLSSNDGTTWTAVNDGLNSTTVNALAVSGTNLFAGTSSNGVFHSSNNGTSWTKVNSGLTNSHVYALAVSGTNLFAGTDGGVWRRPLSEMITSVGRPSTELPTSFSLEQNYPNPFNPSTVIGYTVRGVGNQESGFSDVRLVVYDVIGREVATLVHDKKAPGRYEVEFDASGLASGMYFYRLEAAGDVESRRMILLK